MFPDSNTAWPPVEVDAQPWADAHRVFSGRPGKPEQPQSRLAAVVASTAASLALGSGPVPSCDRDDVQAVAGDLLTGFLPHLSTAERYVSVYGRCAVLLSATPDVRNVPHIEVVPPTRYVADVVDGVMTAVLSWRTLPAVTATETTNGVVYRWLEYRDNRAGTIESRLYKGDASRLGAVVDLAAHPATRHVPAQPVAFPAGVTATAFEYVGRSDIAGVESLIDAADNVLTSLVRDVSLSQTRVVVPSGALEDVNGYKTFNTSQSVFTELQGVDPSSDAMPVKLLQAAIRSGEHAEALQTLLERLVEAAGFSPASFGLTDLGSAESGTALRLRLSKTLATVEGKRRIATPFITGLLAEALQLSASVFGTVRPAVGEPVSLVWPSLLPEDREAVAREVGALVAAKAMSIENAVRRAQPDLDDDAVAVEVARIKDDLGLSVSVIEPTADGAISGF